MLVILPWFPPSPSPLRAPGSLSPRVLRARGEVLAEGAEAGPLSLPAHRCSAVSALRARPMAPLHPRLSQAWEPLPPLAPWAQEGAGQRSGIGPRGFP